MYSWSKATPSGPKSSAGARASSSAGDSKRSMSAPEPPTFGFTTAGKRTLSLAFRSWSRWFTTMVRG